MTRTRARRSGFAALLAAGTLLVPTSAGCVHTGNVRPATGEFAAGAGGDPAGCGASASAVSDRRTIAEIERMVPARGYLDAHRELRHPRRLLGGPVRVHVRQLSGGVFVALPAPRRLDPDVFGLPGLPRAYGGTPEMTGMPPALRDEGGDRYTRTARPTAFGDKEILLPGGRLDLSLLDVTATDAAVSDDAVHMTASWRDRQGNSYELLCCDRLLTHGVESPTFGGVVTNHLLHGITRIGTPLLPTAFAYAAFWGIGRLRKNGAAIDGPRLIHGLLTERDHTKKDALAADRRVDPSHVELQLLVPPYAPTQDDDAFVASPVDTGFLLMNGRELPFWHVTFDNIEVTAHRGVVGAVNDPARAAPPRARRRSHPAARPAGWRAPAPRPPAAGPRGTSP